VSLHYDCQRIETSCRSFDLEESLEMHLMRWGGEVLTRWLAFFLADAEPV
jgi:hypothetical protein